MKIKHYKYFCIYSIINIQRGTNDIIERKSPSAANPRGLTKEEVQQVKTSLMRLQLTEKIDFCQLESFQ